MAALEAQAPIPKCFRPVKILMYMPKFGFSHMNFMGRIADTLQEAGHDVTVVQPNLIPEYQGTGCKKAKVIHIESTDTINKIIAMAARPDRFAKMWAKDVRDPRGKAEAGKELAAPLQRVCKHVLTQHELIEQLRKEKFEIGINEFFDFTGFALFHEIGIENMIATQAKPLTDDMSLAIGLPLFPSYVPGCLGVTSDNMNFFERILNLVVIYNSMQFTKALTDGVESVMKQLNPNAPSIQSIIRDKVSFVFTNVEPLLDFPRPTLHMIKEIGGIQVNETKPLDEYWTSVIEQRGKTVLLSFGSVAPATSLPDKKKETIRETFKRFPGVTFIFKYENPEDGIFENIDNVILSKWMPQTDLLASGKISLFLTHGGSGSFFETATLGVPQLLVPLFSEQMRNARIAEKHGFGLTLLKSDLDSVEKLVSTIRKGLDDKSLFVNAQKMKRLLERRPYTPQETIIKTVNLAAEFGCDFKLSPMSRNMNTLSLYSIDIILFVATISLVFVWIVFVLLGSIF